MPFAPAQKLGPYEIESPPGAGGLGEVYRARDIRLERTVAIKTLPGEMSGDALRKQSFEREAKTISHLSAEGCGEPSYPNPLMFLITDALSINRAKGKRPAAGDSGGRS